MTREEAIAVLNMVEAHGLADEAKKMAIKALEQEPCEDIVSRQAAIEAAMQDINDRRTHGFNAGATRAANRIKLLPPVKPQESKTGHWIRVDKDKCKCDQCEVISFIAMYPNGDIKYCPNCGCRMVEPQESEEKE